MSKLNANHYKNLHLLQAADGVQRKAPPGAALERNEALWPKRSNLTLTTSEGHACALSNLDIRPIVFMHRSLGPFYLVHIVHRA